MTQPPFPPTRFPASMLKPGAVLTGAALTLASLAPAAPASSQSVSATFTVALPAAALPLAPLPLVAPPTVAQALKLAPLQKGIDYDRPTEAQQAGCKVESAAEIGQRGWIVRDEANKTLRRFVDSNGDDKLDQWCYYKDGVEVYRDIDSDGDERADQYRWLGTAGTRWGLDPDEDGRIDSWKTISAEEVTAEIVAAVRDKDAARFAAVLLRKEDLDSLGVAAGQRTELERRITEARAKFDSFAAAQTVVGPTGKWEYFGGTRPSLLPEGTDGATRDIVFYDSVTAMIEQDGQHRQLAVGTLVRLGDGWRVVDAPESLVSGQAMAQGSVFIQQVASARESDGANGSPGVDGFGPEMQAALLELGKFEAQLQEAKTPAARATAFNGYLNQLVALSRTATDTADKVNWIRQATDAIYVAAQQGELTDAPKRLADLAATLTRDAAPADGLAYANYRAIELRYMTTPAETAEQYEERQKKWSADLEKFAVDFASSSVAAEALRELAFVDEISGRTEQALARYRTIAEKYADSDSAAKARGAVWRLTAVGQAASLAGTDLDGKPFDLASMRGKPIVIQCWATWCDQCVAEFETLRSLQAKYASKGLQFVGLNVDMERNDVKSFLQGKRVAWPQLMDGDGVDGALAARFGLVNFPTLILIGADGKVVKVMESAAELGDELDKLLR